MQTIRITPKKIHAMANKKTANSTTPIVAGDEVTIVSENVISVTTVKAQNLTLPNDDDDSAATDNVLKTRH